MLPVVKFGKTEITRLIVGGNPFSGNSHVDGEMDAEMLDFFTTETIKKTLWDCARGGIKTMQLRSDRHIMRIIRELRQEGCPLQWIAQSSPEIAPFESNINSTLVYEPIGIYIHGGVIDNLFLEKKYDEIKTMLNIVRKTGKMVGLGTHMPEVIYYAEENRLDLDFYMACVYNINGKPKISSAITGKPNEGERFEDEDKPLMYKAIQSTAKTCLAFKILGATRNCKTPEAVEAAFKEAYENIKPIDSVVVGMFPKYSEQVGENCGFVKKYCR